MSNDIYNIWTNLSAIASIAEVLDKNVWNGLNNIKLYVADIAIAAEGVKEELPKSLEEIDKRVHNLDIELEEQTKKLSEIDETLGYINSTLIRIANALEKNGA